MLGMDYEEGAGNRQQFLWGWVTEPRMSDAG